MPPLPFPPPSLLIHPASSNSICRIQTKSAKWEGDFRETSDEGIRLQQCEARRVSTLKRGDGAAARGISERDRGERSGGRREGMKLTRNLTHSRDLGPFTRGKMQKPFEDAAYVLISITSPTPSSSYSSSPQVCSASWGNK